jgi:hypothetical protein
MTRSAPDPLNPEAGASLRATRVHYRHRGVLRPQPALWATGVRRVLHIFRYDLSPLLPRLNDEPKPVPVVGDDGQVAFVATARRYHVPISIGLVLPGEYHEQRATLVLDRGGLRRLRLEPGNGLPESLTIESSTRQGDVFYRDDSVNLRCVSSSHDGVPERRPHEQEADPGQEPHVDAADLGSNRLNAHTPLW